MRLLIVVAAPTGRIQEVSVHDVQNEATWPGDGGLILEDGRLHTYQVEGTYLFDLDSLTSDILATARDGKYLISNGELHVVEGWTPGAQAVEPL